MAQWNFPLRPEWLGPRRGLVVNLLNLFAPREENVVWILLVRNFPKRLWGAWMLILLACLPALLLFSPGPMQYVVPFTLFGWLIYYTTVLAGYLAIQTVATAFLRRLKVQNTGADIFMAPVNDPQFVVAYHGIFTFLTLTTTALFFGSALWFILELRTHVPKGDLGTFDWESLRGFLLFYMFWFTFLRVRYWGLVARGLFFWLQYACIAFVSVYFYSLGHDYMAYSEFRTWLFPAGMYALGTMAKRYCRTNYVRMACDRLFP